MIRSLQLVGLLSLGIISACSWFDRGPNYGLTLADLEPVTIEEDPLPVPPTTMEQLEDSYRSALSVATDDQIRQKIIVRLADIQMAKSEQRQLDAVSNENYFADAVRMYESIATKTEAQIVAGAASDEVRATNERILYQLSKAHALEGDLEASNRALSLLVEKHPNSVYAIEAEFRRAEQAFSQGKYESAESLYAQVMAAGDETPFYGNAVYMHGWSQFKQSRYRASIKSFTEVLDRTLVEGQDLSVLSNSERNLISDTLRVISIVFSYLDGAESISEVYANLGERHYQYLLYMNLGDLYLEKNRFRDSADTYLHYVRRYPQSDYSPDFGVKAIEVYSRGDFPSLILPAKQEYVSNYGINSEFWQARGPEQHARLKPNLYTYLEELASYYHATAQQLKTDLARYTEKKAAGKKINEKTDKKPEDASPKFLLAAQYYSEFTQTFPKDNKTPEMTYLMGEAFYAAGALSQAVTAYEKVAYELIDGKFGPDAGYAAIIALTTLAKQSQEPEKAKWLNHKIESQITFSDYFPQDKRAIPVLTQAAQELFNQGNLARAATMATRITAWQPAPDRAVLKTAWLVLAHSRFDLKEYEQAQVAYRQALTVLTTDDPDREQIIERIAASIYRTAEIQLAEGDKTGAVTMLLSINDVAPGTEVAVTAQYDAANYLIELSEWQKAERVLSDFTQRYPQHKLSASLLPKFALVYQELKQWDKAAEVLAKMAQSGDPDVRRQSLYLSAELYEKAGDRAGAIDQYRKYANTYAMPFTIATEARYKLVELYGDAGDRKSRDYWLRELIAEHKKAGSAQTERSTYLAAFASAKFAEDDYQRFKNVKLTLPLKKSLKKKKQALDATLAAYKKVLAYGVAEFSTQANNRIGEVYAQLSRDLMKSPRPKGLDALALEQYEILLEEQAYPFEEKAIDLHTSNSQRAWDGIYDDWVQASFNALAKLLPARYGKKEMTLEVSNGIY